MSRYPPIYFNPSLSTLSPAVYFTTPSQSSDAGGFLIASSLTPQAQLQPAPAAQPNRYYHCTDPDCYRPRNTAAIPRRTVLPPPSQTQPHNIAVAHHCCPGCDPRDPCCVPSISSWDPRLVWRRLPTTPARPTQPPLRPVPVPRPPNSQPRVATLNYQQLPPRADCTRCRDTQAPVMLVVVDMDLLSTHPNNIINRRLEACSRVENPANGPGRPPPQQQYGYQQGPPQGQYYQQGPPQQHYNGGYQQV